MDITVLGSGSAIQFENRASASFLVETDGKKILLDAGFYLLDRMEKAGVSADEIDAVYISHKHPDHFFGLLHLLFALKNKHYKPKETLLVFGFQGLETWIASFRELLGRWIEPDTDIVFSEDKEGVFGKINWQIFRTVHSPESTGIAITDGVHKIVYTGDTEYFEDLTKITRGAELFIAECGSGNNKKTKGHMCLDDIIKITRISEPAKVLLTHIYPETEKTPDRWSQGATEFMRSGDLQKISL